MRKRFFVFSESILSPLRDTLMSKESRHIGMLLCEARSKEQLSFSSNFFVNTKSVCFSLSLYTNHMTFTFLNIRSTIHSFTRQSIFCLLSLLVCLFLFLHWDEQKCLLLCKHIIRLMQTTALQCSSAGQTLSLVSSFLFCRNFSRTPLHFSVLSRRFSKSNLRHTSSGTCMEIMKT